MVSFKNAIIILTSNLGSAEIFNAAYKQKKEGGQVAGEAAWVLWGGWLAGWLLRHDGFEEAHVHQRKPLTS